MKIEGCYIDSFANDLETAVFPAGPPALHIYFCSENIYACRNVFHIASGPYF